MTVTRYRKYDQELINFFIKLINHYISENTFRCESTLPFREEIHLLEKIYIPTEDKHEHMVKIHTQHSQYIHSVLNTDERYKTESLLKCDYCDFSFKYMIHRKKNLYSQTKLWIPPLQ